MVALRYVSVSISSLLAVNVQNEPSLCFVVQECPVTGNGLCDSHGHCAFDKKAKKPYCFCNEGYSGSACNHKGSSGNSGYDGKSVQIGLLVTLLLIALGLTGGVIYMAYEVQEFRKQQISSHYNSLPGGDREMVETVNFTIN